MRENVISHSDCYPFGMRMAGRYGSEDGAYRYGFNGKELDDELKGAGNSYDFGARMYDPRVAQFLSVDPMAKDMPSVSNYSYASGNPIAFIDVDGLGPILVIASFDQSASVEAALSSGNAQEIQRILYYAATHDYVDNNGKQSDYLRNKIKQEHGEDVPEGGSLMNLGNTTEGLTKIYGIRENDEGGTEAYLIGEVALEVFNKEVDSEVNYDKKSPQEVFELAIDKNVEKLDQKIKPLENQIKDNELETRIRKKQKNDIGPGDPPLGHRAYSAYAIIKLDKEHNKLTSKKTPLVEKREKLQEFKSGKGEKNK